MNMMMESKNGLVHRNIKGPTNDCFIFDSWFVSKRLAKAVMDAGAEIIGISKTNTKVFFKDTINNITLTKNTDILI